MKLSYLAKKMITIMGVSFIVFVLASIIYYRSLSFFPFALGVLLGTALSMMKVIMIEKVVDKSLEMDTKTAPNYIKLQYMVRFLFTGILLVAAALVPFISLWGAACGILSFQLSAYLVKFFFKRVDNYDGTKEMELDAVSHSDNCGEDINT